MRVLKLALISALLTGGCFAHDLYLTVQNGKVCAGIGEDFPASQNAITADRFSYFRVIDATGKQTPLKGKVDERQKQFCAPVPAAKTFIADMTVPPRFIKLSGKDFTEYIHGEGLKQVEEERARYKHTNADGRELYSRYTKLLKGPLGAVATKPLGHTLDIVPERDPAALKAGDELTVQVLFKGKPLPDAQVAALWANAKMVGHAYPISTRTDANGKAKIKIDRAGWWYVRLIYMEPAQNDPDFEWRSYFGTMSFEVPSNTAKK